MDHSRNQLYVIKDRWIFFFLCPVISLLAVHIGNETPFAILFRNPTYYSDFVLALACSIGAAWYVKKIVARIELKYNWESDLKKAGFYLLFYGVVLPTVVIIIIEIVYLHFINIALAESFIFYLELPVIAIFCSLLSLIYFLLYYRQYTGKMVSDLKTTASHNEKKAKQHFIVKRGVQSINISMDSVAYFMIEGKLTFLVTCDGNKYLYETPVGEIMNSVSASNFFQLNRQVVANRQSIVKYQQTETRRLHVELNPPTKKPTFIAKTKVSKFTDWLNHN